MAQSLPRRLPMTKMIAAASCRSAPRGRPAAGKSRWPRTDRPQPLFYMHTQSSPEAQRGCAIYLGGIWEGLKYANQLADRPGLFCNEVSVSAGQLKLIFETFGREHPQYLSGPPVSSALFAFMEAYPACGSWCASHVG